MFDVKEHESLLRQRNFHMQRLGAEERNILREIEDLIGSTREWPLHILVKCLSPHMRYDDRKKVVFFLLANMCPPVKIVEWLLIRYCLKDDAAKVHVASILNDHMQGNLNATAYHMHIGLPGGHDYEAKKLKCLPVQTPSFASQHPEFWVKAIAMLEDAMFKPPPRALARQARAKAEESIEDQLEFEKRTLEAFYLGTNKRVRFSQAPPKIINESSES